MAAFLSACQKVGLDPESFTPTPDQKLVPTASRALSESPSPTETEPQSTNQPDLTSEPAIPPDESGIAKIALVRTSNRSKGVRLAIDLLGINSFTDKNVFLKPNFNSADPAPGSTHPDVLRELVLKLQEMGASKIELGDRSGMGNTRQVMQKLGVFDLAAELGIKTLVLDELDASGWEMIQPPGSHWKQGFPFARACMDSGAVVQACCLKTHRYGGHFTMSLKNSVGLVAKHIPGDKYNYMSELHNSEFQRMMIAEINTAYQPALIVMDGVEAFASGGPDQGKLIRPEVMLAGRDRNRYRCCGSGNSALFRNHTRSCKRQDF